jgi:hypothetical protein
MKNLSILCLSSGKLFHIFFLFGFLSKLTLSGFSFGENAGRECECECEEKSQHEIKFSKGEMRVFHQVMLLITQFQKAEAEISPNHL